MSKSAPHPAIRYGITAVIVLAAAAAVLTLWNRYRSDPWTRHAVVHADVAQVAPRVSGPVVEVGFEPNQLVKKGDLLYRIDPEPFEGDVVAAEARRDQVSEELEALAAQLRAAEAAVVTAEKRIGIAEANVQQTEAQLEAARLRLQRLEELDEQDDEAVADLMVDEARGLYGTGLAAVASSKAAVLEAQAATAQARANAEAKRAALGDRGPNNPRRRAAEEDLHHAKLKLSYTEVRAPVDGMVSETWLDLGSFAAAGKAAAAIVDTSSFRIRALFKETQVTQFEIGDRALVSILGSRSGPIEAVVGGFSPGIERIDETGDRQSGGLPRIQPTFDWVRLAQRVPVQIHFSELPDDVLLIVGLSASVTVRPER